MKRFQRYTKQAFLSVLGNFINPVSFFVLIGFVIAVSWIPDGIINLFSLYLSKEVLYTFQLVAGLLILTGLFVAGSYFLKKQLPRFEIYSKKPEKKKNLILFLSYNNAVDKLSGVNSYEDMKKAGTNWQMPVEAINYHLPVLKNIFVILSDRSKKQFYDFKNLINKIFPDNDLNIIPVGLNEDIDFENMENLNKTLEDLYKKIKNEYKAKDKEIIIDVTGGQKLVSIIGAMQTLTHDREFQYVSTSNYEIKSFDVRQVEE